MTLDLDFDDAQQSIADVVSQFCRDRCAADRVKQQSSRFPSELWGELADLGMLAIGTPEGEGGALEMTAAMEVLGAFVFPGPLVASFLANRVLAEADRERVVEGRAIVCAGSPPLMPWAPCADLFLEIEGDRIFLAEPEGRVEPVETLGGEPWGRLNLCRGNELAGGAAALVFGDIALAAYQASASNALVDAASRHAATRSQFGHAIGEFQAVAHPLADCSMDVAAASGMVRHAAFLFDETWGGRVGCERQREPRDAGIDKVYEARVTATRAMASAAKLAANRAAVRAAHVCHQVFGANGITLEGPVFHISRRIRQLASQSPTDRLARQDVLKACGMGRSPDGML